jgi:hypothetical protein
MMEKSKNFMVMIGLLAMIGLNVAYYVKNFNPNEQVIKVLNVMGKLETSTDAQAMM